jgi:hypothetical protein
MGAGCVRLAHSKYKYVLFNIMYSNVINN